MKERSAFWDNYKGILIIFVVFGHFIYSYLLTICFLQNQDDVLLITILIMNSIIKRLKSEILSLNLQI